MANFHSRSNSLPSQTHPLVESILDKLCRLKSSEATSTSSVSSKLGALRDLHECIDNLIQMPSFQQALSQERGECWINELLEGSLRLVDLCGSSRDIVYLTKESVQDLESCSRRSRDKTEMADHINAYLASRRKINKMVKKNLKSFNQTCTAIPDGDYDVKAIGTLLKETELLDFSILKSVFVLLSGEKEKSGSFRLKRAACIRNKKVVRFTPRRYEKAWTA